MKISVDDIAFSVVFTFRLSMSNEDSRPVEEVTKNIFFNKKHIPLDNYDDFSGIV